MKFEGYFVSLFNDITFFELKELAEWFCNEPEEEQEEAY